MNKLTISRWILRLVKILALPLVVVLIFSGCPWLRTGFVNFLQVHPLWGALILGVICFLAGFFLVRSKRAVTDQASQYRDIGIIILILIFIVGMGIWLVGAATIFALEEMKPAAFRAISLWSLAYFAAGFFIGFLFGIPKVLQGETPPPPPAGESARSGAYVQRVNTNLEQISDWLTKIIVGVGLVELKEVPGHLKNAATWVAESIATVNSLNDAGVNTPSAAAVSFAGSIIVFFSIVGFLAGYLITRLFLAGAFGRADKDASEQIMSAFSEDESADRIRKFLRPDGVPNPANKKSVVEWMKANGLENRLISELMNSKELQKFREKIIAERNIP